MRFLGAVLAVSATFALAGCMEYLDRRETIAHWAGDAQQANLVTHAVHPTPRHAAHRHATRDGQRMGEAHERYRTGNVTPPRTSTGPVGLD